MESKDIEVRKFYIKKSKFLIYAYTLSSPPLIYYFFFTRI